MARRRTANGAPKTGMEWPTTLSKNNAGPSLSELLRTPAAISKRGEVRQEIWTRSFFSSRRLRNPLRSVIIAAFSPRYSLTRKSNLTTKDTKFGKDFRLSSLNFVIFASFVVKYSFLPLLPASAGANPTFTLAPLSKSDPAGSDFESGARVKVGLAPAEAGSKGRKEYLTTKDAKITKLREESRKSFPNFVSFVVRLDLRVKE